MDIPEDVLSRDLDGEAVLLDLRSGHYFGLNSTGSLVWSMLRDGLEPDAMAQRLAGEYEIDLARARADVEAFISTLFERGLLRRADSTRPTV